MKGVSRKQGKGGDGIVGSRRGGKPTDIVYHGFMTKLGSKFKTWKKRYFRLSRDGKLFYSKNEGAKEPLNKDNPIIVNGRRISYAQEKRLKSKYCIKIDKTDQKAAVKSKVPSSPNKDEDDDYFYFFSQSALVMYEWFCRMIQIGGILEKENLCGEFIECFSEEDLFKLGISLPDDRSKVNKRIQSQLEHREKTIFDKVQKSFSDIERSKKKYHYSTLIRQLASSKGICDSYLSIKDKTRYILKKFLLPYDEKVIVKDFENSYTLVKIIFLENSKFDSIEELLNPSCSKLPKIKKNKDEISLRSGILIGHWLFEWNDYEVVVPRRVYGDSKLTSNEFGIFADDMSKTICILNLEVKNFTLEKASRKLAYLVSKWNSSMKYAATPQHINEGNCQHFVDELLHEMGVDLSKCKNFGDIRPLLDTIRTTGSLSLKFTPDSKFCKFYKLKESVEYNFTEHQQLDDLLLDLTNKNLPALYNDFRKEHLILQSFDRIFWLRHKTDPENTKFQPDKKCPFKDPLLMKEREYNSRYFKGYVKYEKMIPPVPLEVGTMSGSGEVVKKKRKKEKIMDEKSIDDVLDGVEMNMKK